MTTGKVDGRVPIYDSSEFESITPTNEILLLLAGHAGFDVKQIGNKLFCGSNYATTSQHRPKIIYQSKLQFIDSIKLKLATKRHAESQYGQREFSDIEPIPLSDLVKQLAAHPLDDPSPSSWNRISISIALAKPEELHELLTKTVIPIISRWHPDASLVIVKNNYRLQRFFAASRLLRRFTQIPSSSTFAPTGSLMYWATGNPDQLFGSIIDWSSWILFPHSHLVRMPNHGMEIIITGNDLRCYEPPAFPTSMLELDNGASHMGRGDSGYARQGADISVRTDHYYGRRLWAHESNSSMKLTSWTITRASELLAKLADPYSFAVGTQSDGNMKIEPDKIQLYIWTVDRIIR